MNLSISVSSGSAAFVSSVEIANAAISPEKFLLPFIFAPIDNPPVTLSWLPDPNASHVPIRSVAFPFERSILLILNRSSKSSVCAVLLPS